MQKYVLLFFLFTLACTSVRTQNTFSRRYDFDFSAVVFNGLALKGDTVLVSGILGDSIFPYRTGSFMAMLDSTGELLNIDVNLAETGTFELWGNALVKTEGGYLAVGYAVDSSWNGLLVKYSEEGEKIWEKRYPGFWENHDFFRFTDVFLVNENIYITAIDSRNDVGPYLSVGVLGIMSPDGELLSYETYGHTPWTNHIECIVKQNENEYILGGARNMFYIQSQDFDTQCQIYGVDSTGHELWVWRSPPDKLYKYANSIVPTPDGGQIVASAIGTLIWVNSSNDDIYWDCILFKLNSNHEQEWVRPFRMGLAMEDTEFHKVIACPDNSGYLAAGIQGVEYIEGGNINEENAWDIGGYLGKVSPEGDSLWDRLILHPSLPTFSEYHNIYDIKAASDGGYYLIGQSRSVGTEPSQQGWLVKVDEYGCLVPGCHLLDSTEEVEPEEELPLLLYPNPVSDILNVYIGPVNLPTDTYMRVIDMKGKVHLQRPIALSEATYMLSINRLPIGTYMLQLYNKTKEVLISKQFIKVE
ncbi:MAG: T9SS type A sorting domain-containing protein [Chitinophagales bacterium]|nr:T9SS type A sorting domain-containing protein [Chitinophagales bacterium]